ncbi:PDZ domain-containing protein [Phormidesmis priestleyi ULC007]|uniref:PDZ domain-containing protein n=1 Tax=Phormidesmis priestleyi ULC007 TaxID=1920490 RepID=A0A2T1D6H7_9CYAN|nr:HhoA/HhoB/HtrA family serine endopeptidase [Phormidesmis priestleyi]PSB16122.1 PDZ domain-containing protein [Phormidesmis priestleyi ULC007]PZO50490.1 MAG: PDZ domain-containing protein [Phormidesmis priestleyi]
MVLSFKQLAIGTSLLAIGGGAALVSSHYNNRLSGSLPPELPPFATQTKIAISDSAANNSNFIAAAVEKVGPAVVRIDSARRVTSQVPDALRNPLFKRFFGDQLPAPEDRVERGTGSGFIVSADGRLVTNAHVVSGSDTVEVKLKDGRTFEGKVVGVDPVTDVAAVKINANNLPSVQLGKSSTLIPGQWAIAIGNPFGLDNTVTAGIISAVDRSSSQVGVPDKRVSFIQTDAAINPGNSGGPLLNDRGEVIGINTAIRADAQGLGFAIPIETARRVVEQLFNKGRVEHPFLGIQMVDLTPTIRDEINKDKETEVKISQDQGVYVARVLDNSPAAQGGLQPGDIIQKINGAQVKTASDVQAQVESSLIGTLLGVEVIRGGQTKTFRVRPGAFPTNRADQ